MPVLGAGPPDPLRHVENLAAEPEAMRWASDCAWVPGTGHCRDRNCGWTCVFRPQREAEAARIGRWRRLRRMFLRRQVR